MNNTLKYNKCRACDSSMIEPWLSLPSSPVANALFDTPNFYRYPLELENCSECGHLQLSGAPDPDHVFATYKYRSGVSASFKKHFKEYANDILTKYGFGVDGRVLEIGSNDGYLLEEFKKHNCRVYGVEPSENLIEDHNEKGIPVVTGFFTEEMVNKYNWIGYFDYVCANNVLAHIPDTFDVLKGVAKSLRIGGKLVAECGDQEGIVSGKYLDNVYHEHIDYYSPYSFAKLLQRVNLKVISVQKINTHGVSFRIVAEKVLPNVFVDIKKEKINWKQAKDSVEKLIDEREEKMKSLLGDREFVAYGAAAKAVTALYTLNLVNKQLVGVVDDNELKQGHYFPGTEILITSPEKLDKNALVLVTAWNVFDDIKAKLVERGHTGEIICMQ